MREIFGIQKEIRNQFAYRETKGRTRIRPAFSEKTGKKLFSEKSSTTPVQSGNLSHTSLNSGHTEICQRFYYYRAMVRQPSKIPCIRVAYVTYACLFTRDTESGTNNGQ